MITDSEFAKSINESDYLLESSVKDLLEYLYPGEEIIHNKKHPDLNFRPDYFIPNQKLIVEFDGPRHFTQASVILKDIEKEKKAESFGIKTVRIPYFIQGEAGVIYGLFDKIIEADSFNNFPLGFWKKGIVLPGDFCPIGYKRYEDFMDDMRMSVDKWEKRNAQIEESFIVQMLIFERKYLECFPFYPENIDRFEHYHESILIGFDYWVHDITPEQLKNRKEGFNLKYEEAKQTIYDLYGISVK